MVLKRKYDEGLSIDGQFGTPTIGPGLPPVETVVGPTPEPEPTPALSSFRKLNYAQFHSAYGGNYAAYQNYLATGNLPKPLTAEPTEEVEEVGETTGVSAEEVAAVCGAGGTSVCGAGGAGGAVTPMKVTPAPPYEISPEQQAWQEQYSGKLEAWMTAEGYGIPEETQTAMIQQQTDILKAREAESIRVMRNDMERRGLTNSGFIQANEQNIRANTSEVLAASVRDVQIKSAFIKMASFERAMGATAQFLGYLSEQSQLKYAPEFATWQAEQMAKMQAWQAKIDFQKLALNQCYQQQNIKLTAQLQSDLAAQQHGYNLELAEMELEAQNKASAAQGIGSIFGTIIGAVFGKA